MAERKPTPKRTVSANMEALILKHEHLIPDGATVFVGKLRKAIENGDANNAAEAGFWIGVATTLAQFGQPMVVDMVRRAAVARGRKSRAEARRREVLSAYKTLSPETKQRGKMVVYRAIAKASEGTSWQCRPETVRKILSPISGGE